MKGRKAKEPIEPTWPRTEDQKRQSRPMIVVHPVRRLVWRDKPRREAKIRAAAYGIPKWALDAAAILKEKAR